MGIRLERSLQAHFHAHHVGRSHTHHNPPPERLNHDLNVSCADAVIQAPGYRALGDGASHKKVFLME